MSATDLIERLHSNDVSNCAKTPKSTLPTILVGGMAAWGSVLTES